MKFSQEYHRESSGYTFRSKVVSHSDQSQLLRNDHSATNLEFGTLNLELLLSQFADFFELVNIQNPNFTTVDGNYLFACKG